MSFDWREYYVLACELISSNSSSAQSAREAKLRSAISRAYYAAFCQARDHLIIVEGNTNISQSPNVHNEVADAFKTKADQGHRLIAEHLHNLRISRNLADYQGSVRNLPGKTTMALEHANWLLQGITHLADTP